MSRYLSCSAPEWASTSSATPPLLRPCCCLPPSLCCLLHSSSPLPPWPSSFLQPGLFSFKVGATSLHPDLVVNVFGGQSPTCPLPPPGFLLFVGGLSLLCVLVGVAFFSVVVSLIFNVFYFVISTIFRHPQLTKVRLQYGHNHGKIPTFTFILIVVFFSFISTKSRGGRVKRQSCMRIGDGPVSVHKPLICATKDSRMNLK